MKVTRIDVALAAGVSTATVSNVLNNSGKVKEDTAVRVREVIRQMDYSPNLVARSLTTKRTMQVGIVMEDISNPFFSEVARDFESAADEKGYFVNICTGFSKLDDYFDNYIARGLDGIFVTALPHKFNVEKLYKLVEKGIRIVTSGNIEVDSKRISSIENDFENGMWEAVHHLYSIGHRKIAYLSGLGKMLSNDLRCRDYKKAMERQGLEYLEELLIDGKYPYTTTMQDGYRCALQLLEKKADFTAVICGNDMMALGAMKAMKENGLRIPEDVSVIGMDGTFIGEYWEPSLTTLSLNKNLGRKAFELLYTNMTKGNVGYYRSDVKLLIRSSTAKAGKQDGNMK